jgi:hypothetical protein
VLFIDRSITVNDRNAVSAGNAVAIQSIPGFSGYEHSGNRGYNQVLGVGTLFARNFIGAQFVAPAGNPQTPLNP